MTKIQDEAVRYIMDLSTEKLYSAVDYLKFLSEQDAPLDEFDYQLAREADEDTDTETVTHEELCARYGIEI